MKKKDLIEGKYYTHHFEYGGKIVKITLIYKEISQIPYISINGKLRKGRRVCGLDKHSPAQTFEIATAEEKQNLNKLLGITEVYEQYSIY